MAETITTITSQQVSTTAAPSKIPRAGLDGKLDPSWGVGMVGPQGPAGPAGPPGAPGATGPEGPAGPQGPVGLFNLRAAWSPTASYSYGDEVSYNGSSYVARVANSGIVPPSDTAKWDIVGQKGDIGPQGPVGPVGPKGDKGDTGATGPQGPQGLQGVAGAQGPAGATGAKGDTGVTGATGAAGAKGDKGDKGDTGANGVQGAYVDAGGVYTQGNVPLYYGPTDPKSFGVNEPYWWVNTSATPNVYPRVLAQSAVPVSVGGTTAEITLASVVIPGGTMGLNGALRISTIASTGNGSNSKTLRYKFGGTNFFTSNATVSVFFGAQRTIRNRNSQSSQLTGVTTLTNETGTSSSGVNTGSVNTAVDQTLQITGQTTLETGFNTSAANISGTGAVVTVIQSAHGLNTGEYVKASGSSTTGYNADPVQVTRIDANTFSYPATGTGTPVTAPLIQRYSNLTLEGYTVELLPGGN